MSIRTVVVCEAQVPFVEGGAEIHVRSLVAQLEARGYLVERVALPFKWYPKQEILAHAAAWRMIDLSESNGRRIDLVIGTKFPSYFVRHPNKVDVADPPVPRCVRAVRHAVQRLRPHRGRRGPPGGRCIDLDTQHAGRVPAPVHERG